MVLLKNGEKSQISIENKYYQAIQNTGYVCIISTSSIKLSIYTVCHLCNFFFNIYHYF